MVLRSEDPNVIHKFLLLPMSLDDLIHLAQNGGAEKEQLMQYLAENSFGSKTTFRSPFGLRRLMYCDYFASAKSLKFIEEYMQKSVYPFYANTHTDSTVTGAFTSKLRDHSRHIIKEAINGLNEKCPSSVLFLGSGSTAAINYLVHLFRLRDKELWESNKPLGKLGKIKKSFFSIFRADKHLAKSTRPVVFLSIQEHHANILPWRCSTFCDVVFIEQKDHMISLEDLEKQLMIYADRPLKIGSFTAGSNVTGVLNDTIALSIVLHAHGAYSIFDFSGVGAYIKVDMNPPTVTVFSPERREMIDDAIKILEQVHPYMTISQAILFMQSQGFLPHEFQAVLSDPRAGFECDARKDAVAISPHKMPGGPSTPGVLGIRTDLLSLLTRSPDYTPHQVGGGIVEIVDAKSQIFMRDLEFREEAGTPSILDSIRCGLVFLVKEIVGSDFITKTELNHYLYAWGRLKDHPLISVLGPSHLPKIPVFSFIIKDAEQDGKCYHPNLVSTALNDLFGIQTRSGCMCAALYATRLMGISSDHLDDIYKLIAKSLESQDPDAAMINIGVKPGFTRLSFNYFTSHDDIDFVLDAIIWISQNARNLLNIYSLDPLTGSWQTATAIFPMKITDSAISLDPPGIESTWKIFAAMDKDSALFSVADDREECFRFANELVREKMPKLSPSSEMKRFVTNPIVREMRWFFIEDDFKQEDN